MICAVAPAAKKKCSNTKLYAKLLMLMLMLVPMLSIRHRGPLDDCGEMVPEGLDFAEGFVDSEDLQLNEQTDCARIATEVGVKRLLINGAGIGVGSVYEKSREGIKVRGAAEVERKSNARLCAHREFIMDGCDELMPEWLNFAEGVVDSEDLQLDIFRRTMQQNKLRRERSGPVQSGSSGCRERRVLRTLEAILFAGAAIVAKVSRPSRASLQEFFRVPAIDVSVEDLTCELEQDASLEKIAPLSAL